MVTYLSGCGDNHDQGIEFLISARSFYRFWVCTKMASCRDAASVLGYEPTRCKTMGDRCYRRQAHGYPAPFGPRRISSLVPLLGGTYLSAFPYCGIL